MVKISNASYQNEIHRVDTLSTRIPKNMKFLTREALISGEGRPDNLGKTYQDFTLYFDSTIIVTSQMLISLYF